uniref:G_PROTEIN_RECEP_F1_2 domain-containing protein n=1 Tax=Parastrongyloides trichosuri TaxID=131310 RepID=A0A0N4ZXH7_PARTI
MIQEIVEKLTFSLGVLAISLNLLAFALFRYRHTPKIDKYLIFLKWTRFPDLMVPLTTGVMTNFVQLYPFLGNASCGVCYWVQSSMLCNYMIMLALVVTLINNIIRKLSYMFRYNVFVINKPTFHCTIFERYFTILGLLILPTPFLAVAYSFPLERGEYNTYYKNVDILFEQFPESTHIILLYKPEISLTNTCLIFITVGCIYLIMTIYITIAWYAIPLEKKLKEAKKEGRGITNQKIVKAIFYLRLSIILPVFFTLLPNFIIYLYFVFSRIPPNDKLSYVIYTPIMYQIYAVINPITIMYQGKLFAVKKRTIIMSIKR